jgi:flagellin-like hook-associated protein FlgL
LTTIPVLSSATASILALTRDIGTMSNRIMEMTDKIIVMADNVGTMSGRIVDTETLQQSNFTLTQNSLLSASTVTVNVIKAAGL